MSEPEEFFVVEHKPSTGEAVFTPIEVTGAGGRAMSLTEFLLARIAEDEAGLPNFAGVSEDDFIDESATTRWGERVGVECEAKRRIVEWVETDEGGYHWPEILRPLAAIYADHPDYREEWKP